MIRERGGRSHFVGIGRHRSSAGFLSDPVEDALHLAEMQRRFGLGRSDGRRGLGDSSRSEHDNEHELGFHG